MISIKKFTGKIVLGVASMLALCEGAVAQCPVYLQKQITAAGAINLPVGWSNSLAAFDLSNPSDNPLTVSISPDTSLVTSTKEYKDYVMRYNYIGMGIDPSLDPRGRLMNYSILQGEAVDRAQRYCTMLGLANQRIRELIDSNRADLEVYLKQEWLDFTANSLRVSGTVILYVTGVGQTIQVAKSARAVIGLQDALLRQGAKVQSLISFMNRLHRNEKSIQPFLAKMGDMIAHAKSVAEEARIRKLLQIMTVLGRNKIAQLTAAEAIARRAFTMDLAVLTGNSMAVAGSVAMEGAQTCTGGCDITTTVLLGGNIWKQFAGYRNPYEETMTIVLENKKKFLQEFKEDIAMANVYRQAAEAERATLVRLSQAPPSTNVFYGGFSVALP